MKLATDQRCAYSMTFAADEKTRARIHEMFLKLLREIEVPIREASSDDSAWRRSRAQIPSQLEKLAARGNPENPFA